MPDGKKSKQLVCLADNDEDDRMMLHEALLALSHDAFEIIELCSGEQLMERFSKQEARLPDYIFLDLAMHGMSGFDCIGQIRKFDKYRHMKIIVYTIDSFAPAIEKAFLLGADFYAVKPNSYGDLKDLVKKVFQTDWGREGPHDRVFHVL